MAVNVTFTPRNNTTGNPSPFTKRYTSDTEVLNDLSSDVYSLKNNETNTIAVNFGQVSGIKFYSNSGAVLSGTTIRLGAGETMTFKVVVPKAYINTAITDDQSKTVKLPISISANDCADPGDPGGGETETSTWYEMVLQIYDVDDNNKLLKTMRIGTDTLENSDRNPTGWPLTNDSSTAYKLKASLYKWTKTTGQVPDRDPVPNSSNAIFSELLDPPYLDITEVESTTNTKTFLVEKDPNFTGDLNTTTLVKIYADDQLYRGDKDNSLTLTERFQVSNTSEPPPPPPPDDGGPEEVTYDLMAINQLTGEAGWYQIALADGLAQNFEVYVERNKVYLTNEREKVPFPSSALRVSTSSNVRYVLNGWKDEKQDTFIVSAIPTDITSDGWIRFEVDPFETGDRVPPLIPSPDITFIVNTNPLQYTYDGIIVADHTLIPIGASVSNPYNNVINSTTLSNLPSKLIGGRQHFGMPATINSITYNLDGQEYVLSGRTLQSFIQTWGFETLLKFRREGSSGYIDYLGQTAGSLSIDLNTLYAPADFTIWLPLEVQEGPDGSGGSDKYYDWYHSVTANGSYVETPESVPVRMRITVTTGASGGEPPPPPDTGGTGEDPGGPPGSGGDDQDGEPPPEGPDTQNPGPVE